jgi:hypothetical protein
MKTVASSKNNCCKEAEETDNNLHQLFKPLVLNQRLIRRTESDITTITNSTLPLSTINNESNIPLIYPQFQLGSLSTLKSSPQMHPFIYQENQNKKMIEIKNKPCCSCNKTKCIKKYCECFANNKFCKNCLCPDCRNKDIFIGAYNSNMSENKSKEIVVCTCSKSGCNKKYCECYKEGLKCNIKCRCINCLNCEEQLDKSANDSNKIISVEETKSESGKKPTKSELDNFNVQRISIFINKSQTLINVEKFSKDEFCLLNKKRKKS